MTQQKDTEQPRSPGLFGRLGNAAIGSVDPNLVASQLDVDALIERLDVNALLERVDVDQLLERVDVDRLLEQVDVNRLLDRVDVDRLVGRADVEALVKRAGIPEIVAESTGMLAGSTLNVVRKQVVGVDVVVTRGLRRILGQSTGESTRHAADERDADELSGEPAGIVTRGLALGLDAFGATTTFTLANAGVTYLLTALLGRDQAMAPPNGPWFVALGVVWFAAWWMLSLGIAGKTPGMQLVGLRLTAPKAAPLSGGRVFVRTLVQALSTFLLGLGYLTVLFDGRRRALHDIVAGSELIYDWGTRETRVATPLSQFLRKH